ncbi:hypothetical protein Taro_015421 [Colocasia esculenta]|uniref:Uncharacterized protein n=1 Tax=Colocasia esculenta TaxID=4460 RepID=A0A843UKS1_COLES|nr:hypothetical protein [Colocasia esculenta]
MKPEVPHLRFWPSWRWGRSVAFPGHPLGSGLTSAAAQELGLLEGTPVGTSLIDAHAGGIGVMESMPAPEDHAGLHCILVFSSNDDLF